MFFVGYPGRTSYPGTGCAESCPSQPENPGTWVPGYPGMPMHLHSVTTRACIPGYTGRALLLPRNSGVPRSITFTI
eukprot:446911-Rhodomonas_salina.1